MFQVGEKARVKRDTNYFTQKYEGTVVEILKTYGVDVYEVKAFDGDVFIAHAEFLEPIGWKGWRDEQEPKVNKCPHKNKRYVTLSRTLQYWYCPDCKMEIEK
jgi:hypothetical protein